MARAESLRIAVIGAGPIGIEAALYAKAVGFDVTVFERGEVGEHLSRWGHVRLFTPFAMNCTPLGLETIRRDHPQHGLPEAADLITGNEFRDGNLLPLTLSSALCDHIRMKTEVLHIGRANLTKLDPVSDLKRASAPFLILSLNDKQHEKIDEVDVVLDCSGTYGTPRWIGAGGIPALGERAAGSQIAHGLVDILGTRKSFYAGKSVIVIGGGYSAATSVCALATLAEQNSATWIIWLNRGPRRTPLPRQSADPLRERDRLASVRRKKVNPHVFPRFLSEIVNEDCTPERLTGGEYAEISGTMMSIFTEEATCGALVRSNVWMLFPSTKCG